MAGATTDLIWRGAETVTAARAVLAQYGNVEAQLPPDFHHAVFVRLRPQAPPGRAQEVDISGGAELLAHIARIPGLDALARLERPLTEARARVRIVSPSPKVRSHGRERTKVLISAAVAPGCRT